ncbi:hypothetical protein JCM21900_002092 [Sporobolomyces salmonicolor]
MRPLHCFSLHHLFPPSPSSSQPPPGVGAASVALTGELPASSLFHLALNHLRGEQHDYHGGVDLDEELGVSANAKGKLRAVEEDEGEAAQGMSDDERLRGRFRPTPRQKRHVLILTPDRTALRQELIDECDVSLFGCRRDVETMKLLDRVEIKHLPTVAHLTYFLSTAYTFSSRESSDAYSVFVGTGVKDKLDPSYLAVEPTMVILHSLSEYLDEPGNRRAGLEPYASALALFVSTFSNLTPSPRLLVILDPAANSLSLPTLPLHLQSSSKKKRKWDDDARHAAGPADSAENVERIPLSKVLERFFDYVGDVHEIPLSPSDVHFDLQHRYLAVLRASSRIAQTIPARERRSEVEYVVQRVGEEDPDGEDGGVRIEVTT